MTTKKKFEAYENDDKLLEHLQSSDINRVYSALFYLRKELKNASSFTKIKQLEIIPLCIRYLEHPKVCNVSLSFISNCCMNNSLRDEVVENSGIPHLVRILKGLANDEILNRTCRCLANIALTEKHLLSVLQQNPIPHIIKFLNETEDGNCQQTAIRCLRILCSNVKHRKLLLDEEGLLALSKTLSSSNKDVISSSIKALSLLTHKCDVAVAVQLKHDAILPKLVELYPNADANSKDNILTCIQNISCLDVMRRELMDVNAVKVLLTVASSTDFSCEKRKPCVKALCWCKDIYWQMSNSYKIDLLHILVSALKEDAFQNMFCSIISALTFLISDLNLPRAIKIFGIIPAVMSRLQGFIDSNGKPHLVEAESKEVDQNISAEPEKTNSVLKQNVDNVGDTVETLEVNKKIEEEEKICSSESLSILEKSSSSKKKAKFTSGPVFSIHSPTYQGLHYNESNIGTLSYTTYASFASPSSSTSGFGKSPDRYSFDAGSASPTSCSSLVGPWSPGSSTDEIADMCWSPVVSSASQDSFSDEGKDSEVETTESKDLPLSDKKFETHLDNCFAMKLENTLEVNRKQCSVEFSPPQNQWLSFMDKAPDTRYKETFSEGHEADEDLKTIDIEVNPDTKMKDLLLSSERKRKPVENDDSVDECSVEEVPAKKICSRNVEVVKSDVISNEGQSSTSKENVDTTDKSSGEKKKNFHRIISNIEGNKDTDLKLSKQPDSGPTSSSQSKKKLDYYIIMLLYHIEAQLRNVTNLELLDENHFVVLLNYLLHVPVPNPHTIKVLCNISGNRYSFEKFIVADTVGVVDRVFKPIHDTELCSKCQHIEEWREKIILAAMTTAESSYGIGTLMHILYKGKPVSKRNAIYAIARLVRQKKSLQSLFSEDLACTILCDFLKSSNHDEFRCGAVFLSLVYRSLHPKFVRSKEETGINGICNYNEATKDLVIQLDNGATISTSRSGLTESSGYFNALLEGYYVEATQTSVKLPDVSYDAMVQLLHLIHGCSSKCPSLQNCSIDILVELVKLSERFLLSSAKPVIAQCVLNSVETRSAKNAYLVAKMNNFPSLASHLLEFILGCTDHTENDFLQCISELVATDENFFDCIRTLFSGLK